MFSKLFLLSRILFHNSNCFNSTNDFQNHNNEMENLFQNKSEDDNDCKINLKNNREYSAFNLSCKF